MRTHRVARSHACDGQFWGLREKRQLGPVGKNDRESPLAERPSCGKQMAIGPSSHSGPLSCLWRAHSRLLPASPVGASHGRTWLRGKLVPCADHACREARRRCQASLKQLADRTWFYASPGLSSPSETKFGQETAREVAWNITPWRPEPQAQSQG